MKKSEIVLWVSIAVSILLFIANLGVGGIVGGAVSSAFFGVFGYMSYAFPICLVGGVFFYVANKGNKKAIIKLIGATVLFVLLSAFIELIIFGSGQIDPIEAFKNGFYEKSGGGFVGGLIGIGLEKAFSVVGAFIIVILLFIICLIVISGKNPLLSYFEDEKKIKKRQDRRKKKKANRQRAREEANLLREKKLKEAELTKERGPKVKVIEPYYLPGMDEREPMVGLQREDIEETPEPVVSHHELFPTELTELQDDVSEETDTIAEPVVSDEEVINDTPFESVEEDPTATEIVSVDTTGDLIPVEEVEVAAETVVSEDAPRDALDAPLSPSEEEVLSEPAIQENSDNTSYTIPPVSLLKEAKKGMAGNSNEPLEETAEKLQTTLKNFGVEVTVTDYSRGPAVTRYEMMPKQGVKVKTILGLSDDIKLNLAAADIRIEAPIPGKSAVGIEVPNKHVEMVSFRDLIESETFYKTSSKIAFAAGRDLGGNVMVADIAKMPHVLIAGATGSGKSVCINTIIMSILYRATPDEVKFIMIDPKVVELSVYNGIPHLLTPVVTDPKKAAGALNWAVKEMMKRYDMFAECGVRDMAGFNAKVDDLSERLPQIVVIVDELADLMMVASSEVEEAICRLAQLARAAGIHLIIATQRPSVNVITGLIKANMPSRIAFAVTSGTDSRTILDMVGAEKLLGKGDMLYYPQGYPKPLRVQGAFVGDDEISRVVDFIRNQSSSETYSSEVQSHIESHVNPTVESSDKDAPSDNRDEYFERAGRVIIEKEKGSIGYLQRTLKIGFNRAARIIDQLEESGVVGPEEGTKPRKILMTMQEFDEMLGISESEDADE